MTSSDSPLSAPADFLQGPFDAAKVRAWMRDARAADLAHLLQRDPGALQSFGEAARRAGAAVVALPDAERPALRVACNSDPDLQNPWGNLHGGVMLALADEIGSAAAALSAGPHAFGATTTLATTFIRPLRATHFTVSAEVIGRSLSAMSVRIQIQAADGLLHAEAIATFALRPAIRA
jgi:uncharacterized protein (TIGR00369 family)